MKQAIATGEEIKRLIPQREPMLMIDAFYEATDTEANTGVTVSEDSLLVDDGMLSEAGLVEHIAQSASAFAGYKALMRDSTPPLGLIGEVRKCRISFLPRIGDALLTHIRIISEALGVTLIEAVTKVGDNISAECQMKIYIKPAS